MDDYTPYEPDEALVEVAAEVLREVRWHYTDPKAWARAVLRTVGPTLLARVAAAEADRDSVQFVLDGIRAVHARDNEHLIARAEKAEAEVERLVAAFPCDKDCDTEGAAMEDCSLHGRDPRDLWEGIQSKSEQIETLHAENAALRATVERVRAVVDRWGKHAHEWPGVGRDADEIRAALGGGAA